MSLPLPRVLGLALASLVLSACGQKGPPADPLAYVPADTPYVLVNPKGTPKAVTAAWMGIYGSSLSDLYAELPNDPSMLQIPGELGTWMRAILPEAANFVNVEGFARLGLKAEARYVLYGHGILPVYRFELEDAAKLGEMVKRIESRAGKTIPTRKIDEHTLWSVGDDKATVLFGAIGPYFVATLLPTSADDARVRAQLGLTLPERALADTDTLAKLDQGHGFDGQISGYIDVAGLARRFAGRDAADRAVIEAFGGEVPEISAACSADMDRITAQFPRVAMGTRSFDAKSMDFSMVVELEPATAKAWQALAAPIPGEATATRSMFDAALSANVPKAVSLLGSMADAVIANPFQCEDLAELNSSMNELKAGLAQPTLAMAGSVTAARLGLMDLALDKDTMEPSRVAAYVAVASPTPMMLWGLAQQSVPQLAQVTLTQDNQVVTLPDGTFPTPLPLSFKVVATNGSLGVSAGEVGDADLQGAAALPAQADGTILAYGASGRFFTLLADVLPDPATLAAEISADEDFEVAFEEDTEYATDGEDEGYVGNEEDEGEYEYSDEESLAAEGGDEGAGSEEGSAEEAAAQAFAAKQMENSRAMMRAFGERLERMEVAFRFTDKGIEIRQKGQLK
jgi:hypothetical protein